MGFCSDRCRRKTATCALKIYNPDGSIAEKSGNGVRIFSRYLWDTKVVGDAEFALQTDGGIVRSTVFDGGRMARVEMGKVSFDSEKIPVAGPKRDVINEKISVGGREFTFCAATIGNPHCVLPLPEISARLAHEFGPLLEVHPNFPRKTNVQFLKILDRANIQIEIWERGAGYTLASGSSSSAAAAVAHKLGLADKNISVHMPGGIIQIEIEDEFSIRMTGSVTRVAEGVISSGDFRLKAAAKLRGSLQSLLPPLLETNQPSSCSKNMLDNLLRGAQPRIYEIGYATKTAV